MNKQRLLEMFIQYVSYREDIARQTVTGITDTLADKVMEDDDRWQDIVNYIYAEEKE